MQIQKMIFTILLFSGYLILWQIKRKELINSDGVDANVILKSVKPVQKYFGFLAKAMTISLVFIIPANLFFYGDFIITSPLVNLNEGIFNIAGFITGLAGLALCRLAQVVIGKSWRVGIDEAARPGLVTAGIYNYIRNPTYTGLYILCIGVWMINPTVVFSFWILSFLIMMEFQVRCEEEYLEKQYGNIYLEYIKRTKRYIPYLW